jgi:hypothetical protein
MVASPPSSVVWRIEKGFGVVVELGSKGIVRKNLKKIKCDREKNCPPKTCFYPISVKCSPKRPENDPQWANSLP